MGHRELKKSQAELRNSYVDLGNDFKELRASVDKIEGEVNDLKENRHVTDLDLSAIFQRLDVIVDRIDQLDDDSDRLESFSRRDNVRLYGVSDAPGETFDQCKEKIVEVLNQHVGKKTWNNRDVVRAHRVPVNWKDKPRPIVVKFHHWDDKIMALTSRQKLKEADIGIGNDLTRRQQKTLADLRRQGKTAFYKNGKLIVSENHTNGDERQASNTARASTTYVRDRPRTRLQQRRERDENSA